MLQNKLMYNSVAQTDRIESVTVSGAIKSSVADGWVICLQQPRYLSPAGWWLTAELFVSIGRVICLQLAGG